MYSTQTRRLFLSFAALTLLLPLSVFAASNKSATAQASARDASAVVNVNKATADELQALKGIGPVLADRVIAYRNEHGPFQKQEDLQKVRGIGQPTYERIKEHVAL